MTIPIELLNVSTLAAYLGYSSSRLLKLLYSGGLTYRQFVIPKKNGGHRIITAPRYKTLYIQRKLAKLLSLVYTPKQSIHGFVKGKSIVTNASNHANKRFVINIDLKDFFPSITFPRIFGALKAQPYNIPSATAAVLAHACCHNGTLPIGAPTSPIISNIIAASLDSQLIRVAKKYGLYYTRYADDITFSSKNRNLPAHLISFDHTSATWVGEIIDAINTSGFVANPTKIRIQHAHQHQEVTGITVNAFPNKQRVFIDSIRGTLKSWETYGYDAANNRYKEKMKTSGDIDTYINGCLAHLSDVRGKEDPLFCKLMLRFAKLAGVSYHCHDSARKQFLDSLIIVYDHTETEIGTAFLLYGYGITTCLHVAEHACFVSHWNQPRKKHLASIKSSNELSDIAILNCETLERHRHRHLRISSSNSENPGNKYYFAGFPNHNGIDNPNIYTGAIINTTKFFDLDYYKLSSDVYGGASGAPLVNASFELIGIVVRGLGSDFSHGETDSNLAINVKYLLCPPQ